VSGLELTIGPVPERRPNTESRPAVTPAIVHGERPAGAGVDLDRLLTDRFAIEAFRPWQREAIEAVLEPGGRVLLVAPTGGGKSLCYQLPALALPGTTLVLCPLISLMEDQVRALTVRGIPATFIASSLPWEENSRRMAGLRRGEYRIVYAAPERLASAGFLAALEASRIALVAVDEAHCIVQWGHDFRPDYLRIGEVLEALRAPRILACTATATPDAREEILRRLRLAPDETTVVLRGFARPNLSLAAAEVTGPRDAQVATEAALREALGSARAPAGAAIVYTATRKSAEKLTSALCTARWKARAYHAGLPPEERAAVSEAFASRELPVVVATNAFGMGIDRPDVRVVVHASPSSSLEGYYQEVGRAGRDGAPATGLLLFAAGDIALRRRMCMNGTDGSPASPADAARAWGLFRELLRYVDAQSCRHDFILRYFGDEAESLGGCGHCDVCRQVASREAEDPEQLARDTDVIRRALAGVARAKRGAGMQAVAAMLRGDASERVRSLRLDQLSTFGVLAGRSQEEVSGILRALLAAGWIDLTTGDFPVPFITEPGWRVMRGEVPGKLLLPRGLAPRAVRGRRGKSAPSARVRAARPEMRDAREASEVQAPEVPAAPPALGAAPAQRGKPARAAAAAAVRAKGGTEAALFEALRVHRAGLARELELPAYVIASDRTLADLAAQRPRDLVALGSVYGMGPSRIEKYGAGLLEVIRANDVEP
jgi:ATP-dependent DNA helicase RecQ